VSNVDHPEHYHTGTYETINVIDAWGLDFSLGNAVKYVSRAGKKGDAIEDLRKAIWYIEHEITLLESEHDRGLSLSLVAR